MRYSIFKNHIRSLFTLIILILSGSHIALAGMILPVSGRLLTQEQILPADVLSRVQWLREELALISKELGKPESLTSDIAISGAAPREVYYWAKTLYNKSDRLAFELTGTHGEQFDIIEATHIRPYHVWQKSNQALQRIHTVKARLGITEKVSEQQSAKETTPSDVFEALALASHEINTLLTQRIAPADVFQQVTVSVNTMAQLLGVFAGSERIPKIEMFERYKKPNDVYKRLLNCYQQLSKIAQLSDVNILNFSVPEQSKVTRRPSDVYDLASLIVAELAYFYDQKINDKVSMQAHYPGYKTPSDVFQRVGLLEQQLQTLLYYVKKHPDWLKSER